MAEEKARVLVIDDDAGLTTLVRDVLEIDGYDVLVANSGERGLEIAVTEHPHLVLLDVSMPGMDGYEVCRELQFGYTKDIPVVFLTAKTELESMVAANRSGASGYVTKPFRVEQLLESVRAVLRDASAHRDEITGLPTLANVQVEVQRRLFRHGRLGILHITVEGVGAVERTWGFEIIDDVYRTIGQRLAGARGRLIRDDDFVSVSHVDNGFLVVLSPPRGGAAATNADLLLVKRRLQLQLFDGLVSELERQLSTRVDFYVGYAGLSQSPKVRFRRALLNAIGRADHRVELERQELRHRLGGELDKVLAEQGISCVYQPIVGLDGYDVLGYEVLARGPEQSELHHPDDLFEVARHEDRVAELDRICRLTATRDSAGLPGRYLRFINTEPLSLFFHSRSAEFIEEFVDASPPQLRGQTVVELTENSIIEDFGHMRDVCRKLQQEGFRLAIDDAGAGHSGLQAMVEIEPDFIKLDRSLTRKIESSLVRQKLVKNLHDFCRQSGITLVAEGIETRAQLDALLDLGVEFGQGYLFAHPGPFRPLRETVPPGIEEPASITGRDAGDAPGGGSHRAQ
jgi:EAL domain-containing protein (putative c-di-GMP-specific phosphodiesterase class I)/CheY-like chemotaxis protein